RVAHDEAAVVSAADDGGAQAELCFDRRAFRRLHPRPHRRQLRRRDACLLAQRDRQPRFRHGPVVLQRHHSTSTFSALPSVSFSFSVLWWPCAFVASSWWLPAVSGTFTS